MSLRQDLFYPTYKKARVGSASLEDNVCQKKQVSIDALPGNQEKSVCACVSKRSLMLLSTICGDELCHRKEDSENDGLEGEKATDVRLAAIALGSSGRGVLDKLSIRCIVSTSKLSNFGLLAISRGCPSLKALSLWGVSSVGDEGLIDIANGCHLLEKLDLFKCPTFTNNALVAIAKGCPGLTDLKIESCPNIRNEGSWTLLLKFEVCLYQELRSWIKELSVCFQRPLMY